MRPAAKANKQTGSVDDKDVDFGVVIVLVIETGDCCIFQPNQIKNSIS